MTQLNEQIFFVSRMVLLNRIANFEPIRASILQMVFTQNQPYSTSIHPALDRQINIVMAKQKICGTYVSKSRMLCKSQIDCTKLQSVLKPI